MSNSGRPSLRQRLFGVGLQGRLMLAVTAMVLLAGGFLTYRATTNFVTRMVKMIRRSPRL